MYFARESGFTPFPPFSFGRFLLVMIVQPCSFAFTVRSGGFFVLRSFCSYRLVVLAFIHSPTCKMPTYITSRPIFSHRKCVLFSNGYFGYFAVPPIRIECTSLLLLFPFTLIGRKTFKRYFYFAPFTAVTVNCTPRKKSLIVFPYFSVFKDRTNILSKVLNF